MRKGRRDWGGSFWLQVVKMAPWGEGQIRNIAKQKKEGGIGVGERGNSKSEEPKKVHN